MLPKHFADNVYLPLNGSHPIYQVDTASRPEEAVAAYRSFEGALDQLARPIAIICKSANRSSAVLAAYTVSLPQKPVLPNSRLLTHTYPLVHFQAVKRNFTTEQAEAYSKENGQHTCLVSNQSFSILPFSRSFSLQGSNTSAARAWLRG